MSGVDSAPGACHVTQQIPATGSISTSEPIEKSFPRSARLLTAADYASVFKKNQRFSDRYWTVLVHRSRDSTGRLGLAIAKKRAKRAVDRNKLKRVARESFRQHRSQLEGLDFVIMNRDAAAGESRSTLRRSMDSLCHKIISKYR